MSIRSCAIFPRIRGSVPFTWDILLTWLSATFAPFLTWNIQDTTQIDTSKVSTLLTTTSLFFHAEQQFQNEDDFGGDEEKSEYHKRWQNVVYCEGLVSLYISLRPKRLLKVTTKSRQSSNVILHFLRYSSFQPRRDCHFEDLLKWDNFETNLHNSSPPIYLHLEGLILESGMHLDWHTIYPCLHTICHPCL